MKPMAKNNLTSDDICKIIKACAENGVYKFSVDTLSFELGERKKSDPENITGLVPVLTPEAHDKMERDALVEEEIKTKEEQIQMMLIENPMMAEEMIANGEFENDGTNATSERT